MSAPIHRLVVPFLLLSVLAGCPEDDTGNTNAGTWQLTCGDPACSGHSDHGTPACTTEVEGATCGTLDAACDPGDGCNADLLCTVEDPAVDCPRSTRSSKTDIRYLTPEEIAQVAADLDNVHLATWRYKDEPAGSKPHMGFIIDDLPPGSPAVRADGGHVDLYGYASMNAAALQAQQERIEALERRLAALEGTAGR